MQHKMANVGAHAPPVEAHSWVAHPLSLPQIRSHTRCWLASVAVDLDTEQDLVLAVNEAASNAVEHAYTTPGPTDLVTVSFWTQPRHLCIQVADQGRWREPDADPGHRGRGILIMQQVVESVSIERDQSGTRVFLRHPTTG